MRVVVIGAGEVGFDIARMLSLEQHDVVVVDVDEDALEDVDSRLDVMTVTGSGTSASVLDRAGVDRADMLIAVTAIDEVNVIASMMADRMGVGTTVARVRSSELSGSVGPLQASDFGIDLIIHPEEAAASEVVRLIRRASATDVLTFLDGKLQLVGIRLDRDSGAIGKSLADLAGELSEITFRVAAVARGIRSIVPTGAERLRANDQVFILARPKNVPHVLRLLGKTERRIQDLMILGGNKIGYLVCRELGAEKGKRVKLVESDRERAEWLAEHLESTLVIHGQGTDIDLLAREGLGEMDAFVSVTDDEESNLVTCLLAKHLGVTKTVALLSKGAYIPLTQSIGLDAAVNTKLTVSREIMRFLRGKHVLSVATIPGLDAEVLEIQAAPRSPITRGPLAELKLPKGVLIGAVDHQNRLEIATGSTEVNAGDRAIVFVLADSIRLAEEMFAKP
jgi:trk system potassium uptake protein TrkA